MCGIFCNISQNSEDNINNLNDWQVCKDLIRNRGPDKFTKRSIALNTEWFGHFGASVLWMQGSNLVQQPIIDSNGNILLWNGDIFSGPLVKDNCCDSITISKAFQLTSSILTTLQSIQGPYSFIYFQKSTSLLYFGRDVIGRHSLLLNSSNNTLTLTSVGRKCLKNIIEVPAIGIFVLDLSTSNMNFTCYPWKEPDLRFSDIIEILEKTLNIDINIKNTITESSTPQMVLYSHPNTKDIEYLENNPYDNDFNKTIEYLLEKEEINKRIDFLSQLLHESVKVRVKTKPNYCKTCIKHVLNEEDIVCNHAKVGILFSGGLDSAILTVIADKFIPPNEPIDLINVAFEKSVKTTDNHKKNKCNEISVIHDEEKYDVPDRKTGKQTFLELLQICPNRKWNFIKANITQEELQKYRCSHISDLLHPLCTILDESLGCAVWFASRAKGIISETDSPYESPCRVLLLGMGADELFGGYMRHRTILKHKGWDALTQELNLELARISERNLGRDDRIVSDHGKQARLPYLDEKLIDYTQKLKPWERCYPKDKMAAGLGDKLLLRLLARKLGFQTTAIFPKRAFQFGSRIANGKENAKDISERL